MLRPRGGGGAALKTGLLGEGAGFPQKQQLNSKHTCFCVTLCQDVWVPRQPHENPTHSFHFLSPETLLNIPLPFISSPPRTGGVRTTSPAASCWRKRLSPAAAVRAGRTGDAGVCRWPRCPRAQAQPPRNSRLPTPTASSRPHLPPPGPYFQPRLDCPAWAVEPYLTAVESP